jgi:hypothetical protein
MSDVGHWKKDGTEEARKQAEVAAAAREVASAERRVAGLQAALELGRLVRAGRVKAGPPTRACGPWCRRWKRASSTALIPALTRPRGRPPGCPSRGCGRAARRPSATWPRPTSTATS